MNFFKLYWTYLKVSLGSKGLLTDGALEGLVAGVGAHMDLQGGRRGEVLIANVAQVLVQACNTRASSANFTHKHLLSLIHSRLNPSPNAFSLVLKIPKILSYICVRRRGSCIHSNHPTQKRSEIGGRYFLILSNKLSVNH